MDVVYRLRPNGHEPLRLSLRSLTNLAHDRVWIVGPKRPTWLSDRAEYVRTVEKAGKWENLTSAVRVACEVRDISPRFVLVDDDTFVLEPVAEVPMLHQGPIRDSWGRSTHMTYRRGMHRADELLRELGVDEPLSYELHVPMVIDRRGMLEVLEHEIPPGQVRSMYGNLAAVGGRQASDVKVYGHSAGIPAGPFVSTAPGSFSRSSKAGRALRALFPKPSPYEREE